MDDVLNLFIKGIFLPYSCGSLFGVPNEVPLIHGRLPHWVPFCGGADSRVKLARNGLQGQLFGLEAPGLRLLMGCFRIRRSLCSGSLEYAFEAHTRDI